MPKFLYFDGLSLLSAIISDLLIIFNLILQKDFALTFHNFTTDRFWSSLTNDALHYFKVQTSTDLNFVIFEESGDFFLFLAARTASVVLQNTTRSYDDRGTLLVPVLHLL